jgi:3-oxoacyl-[acyl-carrier-protein] synthase-3
MLFGDAGAAVYLEYSPSIIQSHFHLKSRGAQWRAIATAAGGFRLPIQKDIIDLEVKDKEGNVLRLWDSVMRGMDVFKFAIEVGPQTINAVLNHAGKKKTDIDFFAIHQANGQIVRTVIIHANLPRDKASHETFTKYGNCGGTSVLMNYCDQMQGKECVHVAFVSFGVGLSIASCILDLRSAYNGGVAFYEKPSNVPTREELIRKWVSYYEGNDIE